MSKEFIEKVIAVQAEVKAPKNQTAKFGGYNYRSAEDIQEAVKPILKEHGLLLTLSDWMEQIGDRYYIKADATITDGTSCLHAYGYAREAESKKGMDESQITGSASSYARKYALCGLLLLDDVKDADATNDHGKGNTQSKSQKAAEGARRTQKPKDRLEGLREKFKQSGMSKEEWNSLAIVTIGKPVDATITDEEIKMMEGVLNG